MYIYICMYMYYKHGETMKQDASYPIMHASHYFEGLKRQISAIQPVHVNLNACILLWFAEILPRCLALSLSQLVCTRTAKP